MKIVQKELRVYSKLEIGLIYEPCRYSLVLYEHNLDYEKLHFNYKHSINIPIGEPLLFLEYKILIKENWLLFLWIKNNKKLAVPEKALYLGYLKKSI